VDESRQRGVTSPATLVVGEVVRFAPAWSNSRFAVTAGAI